VDRPSPTITGYFQSFAGLASNGASSESGVDSIGRMFVFSISFNLRRHPSVSEVALGHSYSSLCVKGFDIGRPITLN
jgi:hypothetical protein